MPLTPAQEAHLQSIIEEFSNKTDKKYRAGAEEHGGNLWDLSPIALIDAALEEAIDQVAYLKTLRDKVKRIADHRYRE